MSAKQKLIKHYKVSKKDAKALIDAGLLTPKLIRKATKKKINELGANADDVRKKVG